jgi:hypothetical protein
MAPGFSSRTALRPGGAKSALILAVVIMIALLFAESCGGDAAAARGDMSRGDADLANLKPVSDQLVKQISALFQGVFAGGKVDTTAIKKSADAITVTTGKLSTGAAQARKEYASIDSLKSVPDYKQYADDRIQSIDLNAKQIDSLNTFLDKWSQEMSQATFDPVAFVAASRELSVQMDATSAAIAKLEAQAAALKKTKNL